MTLREVLGVENSWIGLFNFVNDYGVVTSLAQKFDDKVEEMCKWCQSLDQDDTPLPSSEFGNVLKLRLSFIRILTFCLSFR
jgi:hypothetical protein